MKLKNKIALITGATSGIGKACAEFLAAEGCNLIITGRRGDRLEELGQALTLTHPIKTKTLRFDVRDREATHAAIGSLDSAWQQVDILINNAGLALGLAGIHDGDPEDWDTMMDTNVKGILNVTRPVSQTMINQGHGHIVNIGSVAGREVYPKGNVYCASKHAVAALSKGMRIDLLQHGIKVSLVSPGHVNTEFAEVRFKGDRETAQQVYKGFQPLRPEDIAETVLFILTRPAHVNIDDMLIMATSQANTYLINRGED
ncbi:MAG: SDR family NAD(P)-dependent oxidoreductase [Bacteroidia bacterium]